MRLTDDGKLTPDATLGELLPSLAAEDKRSLPWPNFWPTGPACRPGGLFTKSSSSAPEARPRLLCHLATAPTPQSPADTITLYSDLGFMLLQAVVETVSGLPLDHFCQKRIYHPLGLNAQESMNLAPRNENPPYPPFSKEGSKSPPLKKGDLGGFEVFPIKSLGFNPLPFIDQKGFITENRKPKTKNHLYAATEPGLIPGRNICGQVHDENAWAAGGVAGHAGLFGAGPEVFALVAALYRAYQGDTALPFSPATVRLFLTPVAPGARALGFDVPTRDAPNARPGATFRLSVGHLGFTGTSFWLDLELGQTVVLTHQPGAPGPGRQGGAKFPGLPAPVP